MTKDEYLKSIAPLSDEEIKALTTETMHGPLPQATVKRMLFTLPEISQLRAGNEALKHDLERHIAIATAEVNESEALRAKLAAVEADGERWRYWRDRVWFEEEIPEQLICAEFPGDLDHAIDTARQQEDAKS